MALQLCAPYKRNSCGGGAEECWRQCADRSERSRGTARRRGQGSSRKGRGSEPPKTAGRKSMTRSGWRDRVSDKAWRNRLWKRIPQLAEAEPEMPDKRKPKSMERTVVLVRKAVPRTAEWESWRWRRAGGTHRISPHLSEAHTATSRKPRNKASDGGVAGSATRFSIQMTNDRGRGKLSRRSDGAVAKANARTIDC